MEKAERLALFAQRLAQAPASHTEAEALAQVGELLTAVEDEFSEAPNDPDRWLQQDRMYPPRADAARSVMGHPDVTRYRSKKDSTFVRTNGAIRIVSITGSVLVDKAGADGRKVFDP